MKLQTELGRPVSPKTIKTRKAVAGVLDTIPAKRSLSAPEIARLTRQNKYDVLLALRYFHKSGQVLKVGSKRINQPGRPADMYMRR